MVIVLKIAQRLLTLTGHSVDGKSTHITYFLYRALVFVCMSAMCQPFIRHITATDTDFNSSTLLVSILLAELVAMLNFVFLFRKRLHLGRVLNMLQSEFDENKPHNIKHFVRAQRLSNAFAVMNIVAITIPVGCFNAMPLILIAYHKLHDESLGPDNMRLPYDMELVFETASAKGYALGFVYELTSASFVVLQILSSNGLFIGCCMFAMAFQRDVRDYCKDMDVEYLKTRNQRTLRARLIVVIRRHWHFNEWYKHFRHIASGLIFTQIGCSAVMVSIFAYLCQRNFDALYLLMGSFLLTNMFIFCLIATAVTHAILNTGDLLYCSHWYIYPTDLQRYVAMIFQQMQKKKYMNGLGIMDCSLEFFVKVLNSIGTMIAMLQNLK